MLTFDGGKVILREKIVALMQDGRERTLVELREAIPTTPSAMGTTISWMFARDMLTRRQVTVRRAAAKRGITFTKRPSSVWAYKLRNPALELTPTAGAVN